MILEDILIEKLGSDVLRFKKNTDERPRIQHVDEDMFHLCAGRQSISINSSQIDDIINLLTSVKVEGYVIDEDLRETFILKPKENK